MKLISYRLKRRGIKLSPLHLTKQTPGPSNSPTPPLNPLCVLLLGFFVAEANDRMLPPEIKRELAMASGGKITAMAGGLPVWIEGECVAGVGVGGASDEEDIEIARAGIEAIGGKIAP